MKEKKLHMLSRCICVAAILVLLLLVSACAAPSPTPAPAPTPTPTPTPTPVPKPPAQEVMQWKFNWENMYGTLAFYTIFAPGGWFPTRLEELTGGRIKLEILDKAFTMGETIEAAADGRVELTTAETAWISGTYPLFDFWSLPTFLPPDMNQAPAAVRDPIVQQILDKAFREVGVVYLGGGGTPHMMDFVYSNRKIEKVEDFQGLKVRTGGALAATTMKTLGAAPLAIGPAEIEEALTRGTVDAIMTSGYYGVSTGIAGLVDYANHWPGLGGTQSPTLIVNAKAFDALPPDLQQALREIGKEMVDELYLVSDAEKTGVRTVLESYARASLVEVSPAEAAKMWEITLPVRDEYIKRAGPDGQAIVDVFDKYYRNLYGR